jgi:hypothetical protein
VGQRHLHRTRAGGRCGATALTGADSVSSRAAAKRGQRLLAARSLVLAIRPVQASITGPVGHGAAARPSAQPSHRLQTLVVASAQAPTGSTTPRFLLGRRRQRSRLRHRMWSPGPSGFRCLGRSRLAVDC